MMKNKHEIINKIIADTEAKSFLELGYGSGHNFNQIECEVKIGVDPNGKADFKGTTDEFFEQNETNFDVIFIDAFHHCDQVRKDISNALKCSPKAVILHDTIPHSKEMQEVPRKTKQWCGDVWRAAVGFIQAYPEVDVETFRSDYGLTCIYPEGKKVRKYFENMEMTFDDFQQNKETLLNIL